MKIITSHQIEIEGGEEPNVEQIQKEILEGIRSGRISVNDLNNNKKFTVVTKTNPLLAKDNNNMNLYKSDHKEE